MKEGTAYVFKCGCAFMWGDIGIHRYSRYAVCREHRVKVDYYVRACRTCGEVFFASAYQWSRLTCDGCYNEYWTTRRREYIRRQRSVAKAVKIKLDGDNKPVRPIEDQRLKAVPFEIRVRVGKDGWPLGLMPIVYGKPVGVEEGDEVYYCKGGFYPCDRSDRKFTVVARDRVARSQPHDGADIAGWKPIAREAGRHYSVARLERI